MPAALAITPTSGSITAKTTACKIVVSGGSLNTTTGYDTDNYPTEPAIVYYILVDAPTGTDDGRSNTFSVDHDGGWTYNNYIFPAAGSYTLRLRNASNDSDAATLAVTVS